MDDTTTYFMFGVLTVFVISISLTLSQLKQDINRMNTTLMKLVAETNPEDLEKIDQEIIELLKSGKTIKAVKRYRELTGQGLKESKDYVDSLVENITK